MTVLDNKVGKRQEIETLIREIYEGRHNTFVVITTEAFAIGTLAMKCVYDALYDFHYTFSDSEDKFVYATIDIPGGRVVICIDFFDRSWRWKVLREDDTLTLQRVVTVMIPEEQ